MSQQNKILNRLSSKRNINLNRELNTIKNLIKYDRKNFNSTELDEDSVEFIEIEREDNSKEMEKII